MKDWRFLYMADSNWSFTLEIARNSIRVPYNRLEISNAIGLMSLTLPHWYAERAELQAWFIWYLLNYLDF